MASAGSLIFELAADVSRLRTDMGKAQSEIKSSLDSIAKSSAATAIMTGAQYAANFAKGFADKIKSAIDQADAMGKLAQRIGTSTEALSGLNYAAGFAGVSLEDLSAGMKGLNKSLVDSKDATSDASRAYKALGLDAAQLRQMDPSDAFNKIADSFTKFKDGADKGVVANQLFGKSAQVLIPLLNQGGDAIKSAADEAQRMGLVISDQTAQAMSDLNDDLMRIQKQGEGAAAILAGELQPAFKEVVSILREAQSEGTTWNSVLIGIGQTAKTVIGTLVGLVGTVSALGKMVTGLGQILNQPVSAEGMKKAGEIWRDAMQGAQDTMKQTQDRMTAIIHVQTDQEKRIAGESAAWQKLAKSQTEATKAELDFQPNAEKIKKVKKEVDEYANMLDKLSEQLRTLQAEGDPMKELQTDPKFLTFTKQQQQALTDLMTAYLNVKAAQDQAKQAQADLDKQYQQGAEDQANYNKALENFASANLDTLDPMRQNSREMAMLGDALERNIINQDEYTKLVEQSGERMHEAFTSMAKDANKVSPEIKALTQAIEGFGKQSSDAFVDFIFSTKDASVSFSQMVTSILKDLAKMLVYENIMKPLFGMVSTGVTGGGFDFASFLSGKRQSGGPVSAGGVYEINEIPGRREYFIPNVPGRVTTDAGGGGPGGTPGVVVNVHMAKDDSATQDTTANQKQAAELGNRIASVVRQVLVTEKRSGGLLAPAR